MAVPTGISIETVWSRLVTVHAFHVNSSSPALVRNVTSTVHGNGCEAAMAVMMAFGGSVVMPP